MGSLFTKDIAVLDVNSRLISAIVGSKRAQSVFGIKSLVEKQHQGYENGEWFDKDDTVDIAKSVLLDAMKSAESRTKNFLSAFQPSSLRWSPRRLAFVLTDKDASSTTI